jgi:hypothetical protein
LNSKVTDDFVDCFRRLPDAVKSQARKNYRLWRADPSHPSLHFKRVHRHDKLYSVRVGIGWRAVGLLQGDTVHWFWVGSHADYDKLLKQF